MKRTWFFVSLVCISNASAFAQGGGGVLYSMGNGGYAAPTRRTAGVAMGNLSNPDPKDSTPAAYIEASVLMNVRANEYLAVFGVVQEGATLPEGRQKLDAQLKPFLTALAGLGVKTNDIFVDFIAQNRVYDFVVSGQDANEKLTGFEVKKNVAVRFQDYGLLDKMLAAAADSGIFDLIKVDYVVSDTNSYRKQLLAEASKIIKNKEADYARLFGVKMRAVSVAEDKYNAFYPSEMYSSYVAAESGAVNNFNMRVTRLRKTSTFYYNALHPAEFDTIIHPAGPEPEVQLTLYLRLKYAPSR